MIRVGSSRRAACGLPRDPGTQIPPQEEAVSSTGIRQAIEKTAKVLTEQHEKATSKNVPATARILEGLRCEVTGSSGETLHTDMPPAMGGAASAPNPGWVFRAALASCTATTIAMRAARLGIDLTTLEVTVESSSDKRGLLGIDDTVSAGLSAVATRVKIGAGDVAADQLREVVEWGDRHSPVACTARIARSLTLEVEVV
jgi:uncharacterized OsmC-like protein